METQMKWKWFFQQEYRKIGIIVFGWERFSKQDLNTLIKLQTKMIEGSKQRIINKVPSTSIHILLSTNLLNYRILPSLDCWRQKSEWSVGYHMINEFHVIGQLSWLLELHIISPLINEIIAPITAAVHFIHCWTTHTGCYAAHPL